ncbi:MAG: fructose-6-phosphate aldolase [Eubacterium sp.]|nr:fructose-6-phosphate aldolase [Eubacterium sp.]
MKLFIDDAHIEDIKRIYDLYPVDGVTTNPTILSKVDQSPWKTLEEIRNCIGDEGLLFVQAVALDVDGILRDAHTIVRRLGHNTTVIKIPAVPVGIKAMKLLKREGIKTCGTVIYTAMQGYLAAKAGASYVAPYVNRIDNMGYDGIKDVKEIHNILTKSHMDAEVLAASFKNSWQVLEMAEYGVGCATAAPSVIESFASNLAIDGAVQDFIHDFENLTGKTSMADVE